MENRKTTIGMATQENNKIIFTACKRMVMVIGKRSISDENQRFINNKSNMIHKTSRLTKESETRNQMDFLPSSIQL